MKRVEARESNYEKPTNTPGIFFFFLKPPKKYGGRKAWKQIKCWEGKKKKKRKKIVMMDLVIVDLNEQWRGALRKAD